MSFWSDGGISWSFWSDGISWSFWSDGISWETELQGRRQCTAIGFKKAKVKESSGAVLYQGHLCSLVNTCTRKMTPAKQP